MVNEPQYREELLEKLREGQNPPLVVLFCSDSRVDMNAFEANPGEIFGIENAGNVFGLGDESKASLAYALMHFAKEGRLTILVLGHTKCGAVTAACKMQGEHAADLHPSIAKLMGHLAPAVDRARVTQGDLIDNAIEENVKIQMGKVRDFAFTVKGIAAANVDIYGAVYEISENDDVLPKAWKLSVIRGGQPNRAGLLEDITLEARGEKNVYDLVRNRMDLEKHLRMRRLPSKREHARHKQ